LAQGYRPDRVGDQIREELSAILSRGEVHDPGIGFITLTRVQVTGDLQIARVFYTSLGDAKARKDTARALERATGFFRRQVGARLPHLRRVPELEFRFDESIANQDRIERILQDIHQQDAQRASEVESAEPARPRSQSEGGSPDSPEHDDSGD
jgi:ribosome-binding factor A